MFPNLAGSAHSDGVCMLELADAGIKAVLLPEGARYGEPKTRVLGELGPWSFKRAWRYWVAEGPGIPVDEAEALHVKHGRVVRVAGHCGCPSPLEWYKGFGVGLYHVDSAEGLAALARTINAVSRED